VTLQAEPHECFYELMEAKHERKCDQGVVTVAARAMAEHVYPDPSDDDPANEISLRRKAHASNLQPSGARRPTSTF
jgi:hypothetical protein